MMTQRDFSPIKLLVLTAALCVSTIHALGCPFASLGKRSGVASAAEDARLVQSDHERRLAVETVDFDAVKADIKKMFTESQEFWPADWADLPGGASYAPFFVRLAWHCNGSYRKTDGRGGCDGGRTRIAPEKDWPDNVNLDKALKVLEVVKNKHGDALSWGDLITLTGTLAIEVMGGPAIPFCAGRVDDDVAVDSIYLGPSAEQQIVAPCETNGECMPPLGPDTIGLIYVNPEGPMGVPDPVGSAAHIRQTFTTMAMNDLETVALIGGGHAFGKPHAACADPPCGTGPMKGKGNYTFSSGFEGAWTHKPTTWDNEYFKLLLDYDWQKIVGPGGHFQWWPTPKPAEGLVFMLTSDVALLHDASYKSLVEKFASDADYLTEIFAKTWYKLVTRDMGPATRCVQAKGAPAPPEQPWQDTLPKPEHVLSDFAPVAAGITESLTAKLSHAESDVMDGKPYNGALYAALAFQCAATFRKTDHRGGCNGARILQAPEKDWPVNTGLGKVFTSLHAIAHHKQHMWRSSPNSFLSNADLIVLAGTAALEAAGMPKVPFCGGRVDTTDGHGSRYLEPLTYNETEPETVAAFVKNWQLIKGLTAREWVALQAMPRSVLRQKALGYTGSWTEDPSKLTNDFFKLLLTHEWEQLPAASNGKVEFTSKRGGLFMTAQDLAILNIPEYKAIAVEYSKDETLFKNDFAAAWTKFVNPDRFEVDCPAFARLAALDGWAKSEL